MELCMGYSDDQKLDGRGEHESESCPVSAGRDDKRAERRYERFEPITVRAAARVLQLRRAGVVSPREARFYLQELAAMDQHAGRGSFPRLARMAERHMATRPMAAVRPGRTHGSAGLDLALAA